MNSEAECTRVNRWALANIMDERASKGTYTRYRRDIRKKMLPENFLGKDREGKKKRIPNWKNTAKN